MPFTARMELLSARAPPLHFYLLFFFFLQAPALDAPLGIVFERHHQQTNPGGGGAKVTASAKKK